MKLWPVSGIAALACFGLLAACASQGPERTAEADGPVTCRQVLEPPSNVPRSLCYTEANWREYERSRERGADEFLRDMLDRSLLTQ